MYDSRQFKTAEYWTILKKTPFHGDCEDYSLTLLYLINDESMWGFWKDIITYKARMRYCTIGGEGHAVLEYDGMFIDNIQKKWCTKETMQADKYKFNRFPYNPITVFFKLHVIGRIKWLSK